MISDLEITIDSRQPRKSPVISRRTQTNCTSIMKVGTAAKQAATIDNLLINDLPPEVLLQIFSLVPKEDLHFRVRLVCKHWKSIASDPMLWKMINASEDVPTKTLSSWIRSAPLLRTLSIRNRNDANKIISDVASHAKHLERLEMANCWGSGQSATIYGKGMCRLLKRCPNLCNFKFSRIRFLSCKFFKLLMKSRKNAKLASKCSYSGPIYHNQLQTIIENIAERPSVEKAVISYGEMKMDILDLIGEMRNEFVRQMV